MRLPIRARLIGVVPALLLLATLGAGGTSAAVDNTAPQPASSAAVDLAPALRGDGTFIGDPGLAGTIDTTAWTLASDLDAGEAPRFVRGGASVASAAVDTWAALGSNGAGNGALNGNVRALAVSGSDLYVGGYFANAAGIATADYVAKWDGSAWSALGSNGADNGALNDTVFALAVAGSDLYVSGWFTNAVGIATADYIAKWNGSAWSALGSNGAGNGALNDFVYALAVSGSDLYVGGFPTDVAGIATADYVAKWNGSAWSALGDNGAGDGALNGNIRALAVSGADLYVGGFFTDAAGIATADYVAKWDGSAWSALGSNGAGDGALNDTAYRLAVAGSNLYVGGYFTDAAGIATADFITRWDGSAWAALGDNGAGDGAINSWVFSLAVSGSDLYIGGFFTDAAGILTADHVAKWDGSAWSALGSNGAGDGALSSWVFALAAAGSDLYVGGDFTDAAGIATADHVAAWGITAVAAAHLTLVKTVDNTGGGTAAATDWTLTATGPTTISGSTGDAAITNAAVDPGTYVLSEAGPSGYTASDWHCTNDITDGTNQTGDSLVLAADESVTCTITNTFVATGPATYVSILLDRSGSMRKHRSATIGAYNTWLAGEQAALPDALATMALFNSCAYRQRGPAGQPITDLPVLTKQTYHTGCNTPLYGAIAKTINRAAANPLSAGSVQIVVYTDGRENASRHWTRAELDALIADKVAQGWTFVWLGNSLDPLIVKWAALQ